MQLDLFFIKCVRTLVALALVRVLVVSSSLSYINVLIDINIKSAAPKK